MFDKEIVLDSLQKMKAKCLVNTVLGLLKTT